MLITPDSEVTLYEDIPITAGYQLVFSSRLKQKAYFASKKKVSRADCTYIKKTGRLRIEYKTNVVQRCNYISFKNSSFENVTFYARITDYEYVNNVTTDIYYSIDWWQTYMFDAGFKSCTIAREHLTKADHAKAVENPWRRDIPELLTDEGLACGKTSEKIYETNLTKIAGDRFRVPVKTETDDSDNMVLCMFLSSFDIDSIVSTEAGLKEYNKFITNFTYCETVAATNTNGQTYQRLKFTDWKNNYGMSYSICAIEISKMTATEFSQKPEVALSLLANAINFLTAYGITSSIIGLYTLPGWIFTLSTEYASNDRGTKVVVPIKKYENHDPKLNTSPFRYLRVSSPLDTKEYMIELFANTITDGSAPVLYYSYNLNGIPSISISPLNYKNSVDYYDEYVQCNYEETITFQAFPQTGFSCDAYLTYLSQQYANWTVSGTLQDSDYVARLNAAEDAEVESGMGWLSNIGSFIGNVSDAVKEKDVGSLFRASNDVVHFTEISGMTTAASNREQAKQNIDAIKEAKYGKRLAGSDIYDGTKRAFIADKYTRGSSSGYLPYQFSNICFYITIVSLNETVLNQYDKLLAMYGYNSGRIGVPHICHWLMDGSYEPYFAKVGNDLSTYVQTNNMHVTNLNLDATNAIESLFNAGCRFVKGDLPDET